MYGSHGRLDEATRVSNRFSAPRLHMWSSIILAHARHGQPAQGIKLHRLMLASRGFMLLLWRLQKRPIFLLGSTWICPARTWSRCPYSLCKHSEAGYHFIEHVTSTCWLVDGVGIVSLLQACASVGALCITANSFMHKFRIRSEWAGSRSPFCIR